MFDLGSYFTEHGKTNLSLDAISRVHWVRSSWALTGLNPIMKGRNKIDPVAAIENRIDFDEY
jgi:hypothetical protein